LQLQEVQKKSAAAGTAPASFWFVLFVSPQS
jgi:hypothetical protein